MSFQLVAITAIIIPIILIVFALLLKRKYQKEHSKEWYGGQSANNFTMLFVIANIIALLVVIYILIAYGFISN